MSYSWTWIANHPAGGIQDAGVGGGVGEAGKVEVGAGVAIDSEAITWGVSVNKGMVG